jgi:hypothetical protein
MVLDVVLQRRIRMATKKELEQDLKRATYDRDQYNKRLTEQIKISRGNFQSGIDSVRRDNYVIPKFEYDPNHNGFHLTATIIVVFITLASFVCGIITGVRCNDTTTCTIDPDRVMTTYNPAYRLGFALTKPLE